MDSVAAGSQATDSPSLSHLRLSIKVRLGYCGIFFAWTAIAYVLRDWSEPLLAKIPAISLPCGDCMGVVIVFRVSFVLFVFYAIMGILLLRIQSPDDKRMALQNYYWWIKVPVTLALFGVTLAIPNSFFIGYAQLARALSAIYILIQVVYIILFGYVWNQSWATKAEADPRWIRGYLLIGICLFLFVLSIVMIVLMYIYYTTAAGCSINTAFTSVTLVLCVLVVVLTILTSHVAHERGIRHGTLVTASLVCVYMCYLCWSAMQSEPKTDGFQCNSLAGSGSSNKWLEALALVFTIIFCVYSAFDSASNSEDPFAAPEPGVLDYTPAYFHLVFALASCYIAMILSDWDIGSSVSELTVDQGWGSVWVKMASQWVACVVYVFTLAAPLACPNREFVFAQAE